VNSGLVIQPKSWAGILPLILAIHLTPQTFSTLSLAQGLALLIALGLNILAVVLAGSLRSGLWTGYIYLSITAAWAVSGLGAALWLVVIGAVAGFVIRRQLGLWHYGTIRPVDEISGRICTSSGGLLVSWGTWTLLGQTTPIVQLQDSELILLGVLSALLGWMTVNILGIWWTDISPRRRLAQVRGNLTLDLLLQGVGLVMPPILAEVGIAAFALLAGLAAAQAIRHHQLQRTRRILMQRFNEMAILNDRSHEVMFNPNRQQALGTACEIARDLTLARYVAIFLIDQDPQQLHLSHIIGSDDDSQPQLAPIPLMDRYNQTKTTILKDLASSDDPTLAQHAQALGVTWGLHISLAMSGLLSGVLALYNPVPLALNSQQIKLLEMLAVQLVAALDNETLLTTLEMFASEQAQLVHLARSTSSSLELTEMLASIVVVMGQIIPSRYMAIALRDTQKVYLSDASGKVIAEQPCHFDEITELATLSSTTPTVRQMRLADAMSAELRHWDEQAHGLLVAPLLVNRQLFGALVIYHDDDYTLNDNDARLLEMSLYQAAAQLYNAHQYAQTERASVRRLRQLSLLEDIARQITQSLDVEHILDSVLEAALQATDSQLAAIGLADGDHLLITRKEILTDGERRTQKLRFDRLSGIMGQVMSSGELVISANNSTLAGYVAPERHDLRSSLVVPLQVVSHTIGALSVESLKANYFNAEHVGFLRSLAGHAATTINNAKLVTAFQQSVERTNAILGAVQEGILLLDENGLLQSVNPAAESLLGLNLLARLSLRLQEAVCQGLDEQDERHKLCELLESERFGESLELHFNMDGDTHSLQATMLPVANDATPSGRLLVLRDIRQEKRLADERQLVQKAIVHDLLNPLQIIIYSFGILESDERIPMDETNVYAFTRGMDAIQRLKHMANTILDVEKGIEARRVHVTLDEIVRDALSLTSIVVEDQNNHVDYVTDGLYTLEADMDLLTRTLINLITNANKFLPKDRQGLIRISTHHLPAQQAVLLRVSDSGSGIPDHMREEIFKEYRQLETHSTSRRGWGIGLTFCRLAVEAHQGRIWAEPNGTDLSGACFAIHLPIQHYAPLPLHPQEKPTHE